MPREGGVQCRDPYAPILAKSEIASFSLTSITAPSLQQRPARPLSLLGTRGGRLWVQARMEAIARAIADIAARPDVAVVFPVHPNPNVRPVMDAVLGALPNVAMIEPLDYPHFVRLLDMCHLVLTDSGGVQEEAPSLGKPVLVMRETTERPEGVQAGTAKLVGADRDRIVREVLALLDDDGVADAT